MNLSVRREAGVGWVVRMREMTYVDEQKVSACLLEHLFLPLVRADDGAGVVWTDMRGLVACRIVRRLTLGEEDALGADGDFAQTFLHSPPVEHFRRVGRYTRAASEGRLHKDG